MKLLLVLLLLALTAAPAPARRHHKSYAPLPAPGAFTQPVPGAAYALRAVDQQGQPVPGVSVRFCTDTACILQVTGPDGWVRFTAPPERYHVELLLLPDGFRAPRDFSAWTEPAGGEILLEVERE